MLEPGAAGRGWPPDYAAAVDRDAEMMQAAGITHVRTYGPIGDRSVLDRLHARGISVLMTVYSWGGDHETSAVDAARAVMDHPAVVMWLVGNEWNYTGYYTGVPFAEAVARTERIAASLKALDPSRPVATVYGELPSPETLAAIPPSTRGASTRTAASASATSSPRGPRARTSPCSSASTAPTPGTRAVAGARTSKRRRKRRAC
ncbi:MAG: hypothetical protein H6723_03745 [Sandaracinus sp.]|nr:hypothetical protein [Sandaracinus sp.]